MTNDKLTPVERLFIATNDALADAYRRGVQDGRKEVLGLLSPIVVDQPAGLRDRFIEIACRELAKWGM